ncbi:Histone acetyltransferase [Arachis hypogaea]|nr:Histone acetyltransferase [Arachis hypogaea]
MENKEVFSKREIKYRSIQPSDEHTLQRIHDQLFPIRYESKFYQDVANGRGTESWGAVDVSRSDGQSDELIGFVTTRIVPAAEVEIVSIHGNDLAKSDETLVHVLTLGVVKEYRHHGIASDLLKKVIENASMIQSCRAVYLHSSSENEAAVNLYKKMSFKLVILFSGLCVNMKCLYCNNFSSSHRVMFQRSSDINVELCEERLGVLGDKNED